MDSLSSIVQFFLPKLNHLIFMKKMACQSNSVYCGNVFLSYAGVVLSNYQHRNLKGGKVMKKLKIIVTVSLSLLISILAIGFIANAKDVKKVKKAIDRFIAYDNGTVLDTKMNLMWAAKDNGGDIRPEAAESYCKNYRAGGYTDWRMPYGDELAELYDASKTQSYEPRQAPLHVATELIKITSWGILAAVRPQPGMIGVIGIPAFSFQTGDTRGFMMCGSQCGRVLPVRSVNKEEVRELLIKAGAK